MAGTSEEATATRSESPATTATIAASALRSAPIPAHCVSVMALSTSRAKRFMNPTAEIERRLENAPVPIRAMSEKQWQLLFMEMLGNVQALLGGIGLATAFTLFLITSNTLAMSALSLIHI